MTPLPLLFAQETTTVPVTGTPSGPETKPPPAGGLGGLLFPLALFGLFYFVVIFPMSRRQKKEQAAMMASMKQGSKIVTTSGIVGVITSPLKEGEDEVVIRTEDTKIRVLRSTIQKVITKDEPETKA